MIRAETATCLSSLFIALWFLVYTFFSGVGVIFTRLVLSENAVVAQFGLDTRIPSVLPPLLCAPKMSKCAGKKQQVPILRP